MNEEEMKTAENLLDKFEIIYKFGIFYYENNLHPLVSDCVMLDFDENGVSHSVFVDFDKFLRHLIDKEYINIEDATLLRLQT